ncbi:baseplate J/gp47 family protein [Bosea sp. (in: a-proteobacteria)]|jgi:phage-related baseplate assembly protein|uniref:baseplate J/gp47 family protein n=1 Tax=Bosea sp. (in: a-proteobacteria) TaxID=1871050 RepID=UPI003565DD3B
MADLKFAMIFEVRGLDAARKQMEDFQKGMSGPSDPGKKAADSARREADATKDTLRNRTAAAEQARIDSARQERDLRRRAALERASREEARRAATVEIEQRRAEITRQERDVRRRASLERGAAEAVRREGATGNGFIAGQISTMLDPLPGVSAANIATSEAGADIEDVELYRLRVANAFDAVSPGGGLGWYTETAMGVSSAIIDVAVIRPEPCYVDIYPLTAAGAAGTALRDQVKAAFNTQEALDIRFGDEVTIKVAVAVAVSPGLTIRLRGATAGAALLAATTANKTLVAWREQLGVAVAPSEIEDQVKAALKAVSFIVIDVEVTDMPFEQLAEEEFAAPVLIAPEDVVLEVVGD